ncbi:aminopeptidase N-like [Centruroides vittatus]|uniref:aminopeptidase N-like n=1 Tax=Centruroides vittatus TaxID=120091 RepID=UPI00350F6F7C
MDGCSDDGEGAEEKRAPFRPFNFVGRHWVTLLAVFLLALAALVAAAVFGFVVFPFLSAKAPRGFRLPPTLVPENYLLEIRPYLAPHNLTFRGSVLVTVTCALPTKNVTVHSNNLTVDETRVTDSNDNSTLTVEWLEEDEENQFLILHLDRSLRVGNVYRIFFRFSGVLNDSKVGFYWSSYQEDGATEYLAVTHFEPVDARRCFPCFDEPALKATFDVTIVRWRNMTSLSNMPKLKSEDRDQDWVADVYQTSVKMSTYLVALFVGNFYRNGDDKFAIWTTRNNLNRTQLAFELTPKFIKFFENILQVPYSLPKLDMVSVPEHKSSAMENWGLIVYHDANLLYDPEINADSEKQFTSRIIAHEISHQWFGNLVTPKWWQDIWLSEGLATYLESIAVDAVLPGWNMVDGLVRSVENIVAYDCSDHSIAVSQKVDRTPKLFRLFNSFTYKKGGMIARMVHHVLGNETFWRGLSSYLKEKSFDSVEENDLWRHFTQAQPKERAIQIGRIMESWTHNRGYPVVTAVRDYDNGRALLTQTSCLTKHVKDKNFLSVWKIPLTYTDGRNPDWTPKVRKWLGTIKGTLFNLPGSEHWILINIRQVGYYHVNYDLQNWKLLSAQLQKDHRVIPVVNRRQLLRDVSYFVRDELLNYDTLLEMSLFLRKEEDHKVLEALFYLPLSDVHEMVRHNKLFNTWKNYVHFILGSVYEYLGWEERKDDSYEIKFLRRELIYRTCSYEYLPCLESAAEKYRSWMAKEEHFNKSSSLVVQTVFCTAVRHGDSSDWNNVVQLLSEYEKNNELTYALGCSTNVSQINRYLESLLKSGFDSEDVLGLFRSILENEIAWTCLFDFVDNNWETIVNKYYNSTVTTIFNSMKNIKELQELENVFDNHNQSLREREPVLFANLEKVLKSRQNNFQPVQDWLQHQSWNIRLYSDM